MKTLRLFFILIILYSCQNQAGDTSAASTAPKLESDTLVDISTREFPLVKADSLLYTFFKTPLAVDSFIHQQIGVICIEPGPGVQALIKQGRSAEDLMAYDDFLFLCRDISFIKPNSLLNPPNFDPCNWQREGYVIQDLAAGQNHFHDLYAVLCESNALEVDKRLSQDLHWLDAQPQQKVMITWLDKQGDLQQLTLHFFRKQNTLFLAAMDLRECGV